MKIEKKDVIFENSDMDFAAKFGIEAAISMVLDYKNTSPLPFIYDTRQLAAFLCTDRRHIFRFSRKPSEFYRKKVIKKKNGKDRVLYSPCSELKYIQRIIADGILSFLPVSKYAKAYLPGCSIQKNAKEHVGKKYILKLDICDFFGSISFEQVYRAAFNTRYFPKYIGYLLTLLCTKDECLPQGAPTSPMLSNIVMRNFDDALGDWCKKRGITYTRYCDDMTFSADIPLYRVLVKVRSMLEGTAFELNEQKMRFITSASRQSVTGLTVNEKVTVLRDYKRALRQEIYYLLKYGAQDAIVHAGRWEFITDGKTEERKYINHIIGRVRFVLHTEPQNRQFIKALTNLSALKKLY